MNNRIGTCVMYLLIPIPSKYAGIGSIPIQIPESVQPYIETFVVYCIYSCVQRNIKISELNGIFYEM